ncbi:M23 family metallopeptidase [Aliidiomarina halalkaliphila]|uniref:M23 family metallopeptidase n=2 Tax=Aliidiomarina halalkaliphila TaxID=2593535 RepID=A0A552X3V5_9GAMM|nr:M23 family metallopeptidase [Aliidiomarina halalkaliphila]
MKVWAKEQLVMRNGIRIASAMAAICASFLLLTTNAYAAEPELKGEFVQGGLIVGRTNPDAQVIFNGEPVKVGAHGHFVFGIGRDDEGKAQLQVRGTNGESWSQAFPIASREFDIQRVDGLPQQTVTPDPETQERIRADNVRIGAARNVESDYFAFAGDFEWPAQGRITGVYGSQRILNGVPGAIHWGLDIAAPTGTPVYAPAAGEVRLTAPDMVLSGGTIIIDHGHEVFSSFLHLHAIHVEEGQYVEQGTLIGEIGATGRATGPHLDWRMNWRGVRVDPWLLLEHSDN